MPANIVKISGEYVASRLIARRNDMMRFGLKYYEILNKEVDVAGTDKKELFHIQRLSSDELRLTVQKFKNDQPGDTLYDRIFKNKETNKLYLYGLGEDDAFQVSGEAANRMKVTVNGGEGKDKYLATSGKAGRRIRIFDEKNNQVSTPAAYKARFTNDTSLTNYNRKRFEYDWYMPQFLPAITLMTDFSWCQIHLQKKPGERNRMPGNKALVRRPHSKPGPPISSIMAGSQGLSVSGTSSLMGITEARNMFSTFMAMATKPNFKPMTGRITGSG